jgi:Hydantoinase B/oxoprolinase
MTPVAAKTYSNAPDPITLTLFANRFMSVAEAMGRSLQQTSISTNIKERLDFSCALFAPDGDLVANAPFIPIHLGSMSLYVSIHTVLFLALAYLLISLASEKCCKVPDEIAW